MLHRLELDVTSKESIAAAVKIIESADGKLDILINKFRLVSMRPQSNLAR